MFISEEKDLPAVRYDEGDAGGWIEICSRDLINVIQQVNRSPSLRAVDENEILEMEMEPYPALFHHLKDVQGRIKRFGDEDAQEDLKALEHILSFPAGKQ